MNVYGSACSMCCGDLDDVAYRRTGAAVCLSCGYNAEASASTPPHALGQLQPDEESTLRNRPAAQTLEMLGQR